MVRRAACPPPMVIAVARCNPLERLGEPGLQKFAQLRCRFELWDGIQFLECRSECVREAPDRSRPEFLVPGLEVQIVHGAGKVLGSFESALDECLVDDHLGGDVRQLTFLPGFHLLSHGVKVSLHPIDAHRNAVDERERLRVFGEHGREHAGDNVSKFHEF